MACYSKLKKELDLILFNRSVEILNSIGDDNLYRLTEDFIAYCEKIDVLGLQKNWTNQDRDRVGPIELIDMIGKYSDQFKKGIGKKIKTEKEILSFIEDELRNSDGKVDNKKLSDNPLEVFIGMLIGSCFNSITEGKKVQLELQLVTA